MIKNDKIHKMSNVYGSAVIGKTTKVGAFVEIGKNVVIGEGCSIACGAFIPENVIIGNNVFIGPHAVFVNDKYAPSKGAWKDMPPTIVEDDVSIGANSTIMPNITIGKGATIGAHSLVTKNVDSYSIVFGVPAKVHGRKEDG